MAKGKKVQEKKNLTKLPEELVQRGREVWLAGLGALDMVEEKGSEYFRTLVERGKEMESRGKKEMTKVSGNFEASQKKLTEKVEENLSKLGGALSGVEEKVSGLVETALAKLDLPTRKEVQDLSRKVNTLARKVEELASMLEKEEHPA